MMLLIESRVEALDKALDFMIRNSFAVAPPVEQYIPNYIKFPCLIGFYGGRRAMSPIDHQSNRLHYHICTRALAKCLVYHKTNIINKSLYSDWIYVSPVRSAEEFVAHRRSIYGRSLAAKVTSSNSFTHILNRCTSNFEPFLYTIKPYFDFSGKISNRQEILDMDTAKSLVYHQKNAKTMCGMLNSEIVNLVDYVSSSYTGWADHRTKTVEYVGKIHSENAKLRKKLRKKGGVPDVPF